jgi:hypothetical protein
MLFLCIFTGPFLEVIRSEETTGPVTSLALSAVNKFISYGLIGKDVLFCTEVNYETDCLLPTLISTISASFVA